VLNPSSRVHVPAELRAVSACRSKLGLGTLVLCIDGFVRVMLTDELTEEAVYRPENPPETASHFAVLVCED